MKELSLHILDLVQNSIRAKATNIEITVEESVKRNNLLIGIKDNGCGMTEETLQKVSDPFFTSRTTRKVGLGISLFKQHVEQCNGVFRITSSLGNGTYVEGEMQLAHWDRQPMGDIAGTLVLLFTANPSVRYVYKHSTDAGKYVVDTNEIKNVLGTSNVNDPGILKFIKEMINENLREIHSEA